MLFLVYFLESDDTSKTTSPPSFLVAPRRYINLPSPGESHFITDSCLYQERKPQTQIHHRNKPIRRVREERLLGKGG